MLRTPPLFQFKSLLLAWPDVEPFIMHAMRMPRQWTAVQAKSEMPTSTPIHSPHSLLCVVCVSEAQSDEHNELLRYKQCRKSELWSVCDNQSPQCSASWSRSRWHWAPHFKLNYDQYLEAWQSSTVCTKLPAYFSIGVIVWWSQVLLQ